MNHQWDSVRQGWHRKLIWDGGCGWVAAAIVQVLKALPDHMTAEQARLSGYLNKQLAGVLRYQTDHGLFQDILDDDQTFVEKNAAQMIAYSIYRGVTSGYLDDCYISTAERMREAANG